MEKCTKNKIYQRNTFNKEFIPLCRLILLQRLHLLSLRCSQGARDAEPSLKNMNNSC